jgi:adenosine kinase
MLIITGTIGYDYIMDFPGKFSDHVIPEQIHQINLSFIVQTFERRRGGTAGNASYSLGLLGTDHILFSYAGKDFRDYKKSFTKLGINTQHISIDKTDYTATGFAMTDKTHNQIWGYFYGASRRIPELKLETIATPKDFVLIGPAGAAGSISFVKQCIKHTIPYMFDPGFILTQVSDEDLTLGVDHAAYLIGNDYEINLIKSRIKHYTQITKHKTVITTLGNKGAVIEQNGKKIIIEPATVKNVVDPTGAGDSWRSGFLAGMERGYDVRTCGQMGAITAAYTVEQYGTQEHRFSKRQFEKRYRQTYGSVLKL